MDAQSAWLWFYVACMAAGVLLFWYWSTDPRGVPKYEYLIALFIPVWSGLVYTAMAMGLGSVVAPGMDGEPQVAYWARYVDWSVTTPLLLIALALTGMATVPKHFTLIGALVATDLVMILCGLVADLTGGVTSVVFYTAGCVAFGVVLWLVWGPVRRVSRNQDARVGRAYDRVAGLLTVLWLGYPTIWLLGPSGVGVFGHTVDTALFVLLPIVSKVGFSIFDLHELRNLGVPFYNEHEVLGDLEQKSTGDLPGTRVRPV